MTIDKQLLTPNKYSRPGMALNPSKIAWHYVGNPGTSAQNNRNYFENLKTTHAKSVSSHYVIGLGGEIIQCIPENEWSYCTNQANSYTISIECCHPDTTGKFTAATENALIELSADICRRHGFNPQTAIIRHHDVTGKVCPKYYVDHPDAYADAKNRVAALLGGAPTPSPAPSVPSASSVNVTYRARTKVHGWLSEVGNLDDYAGYQEQPITDIAMRVSIGAIEYRVHALGGGWLPWVTGCDINNPNGYAGNGKQIDAVQAIYRTPAGMGNLRAKYRVAPCNGDYYPWQYDNETGGGMDGYAGTFGKAIGSLQICIE